MKKLLLLYALASFTFASAQITTNAGTFNKPSQGDTAFEMQFMPNLDGAAMFTDRGATVTMRKFESETKATRWAASLDIIDPGFENISMAYSVGLGYGVENHFNGAERLSTFWGYQVGLNYDGIRVSDDRGDDNGDVDGDGDGDGDEDGDSGLEDGNDEFIDFEDDRSVFGVGVGVFLGADYYIIPKVYIGVEMGYGLRVLSSDDFTSWGLGGGVNGMMRVGFRL